MKKNSRRVRNVLRQLMCFVLVFALAVPSVVMTQAAEAGQPAAAAVTENELIAKVNPILKSYDVSDAGSTWAVTSGTRFVVEATGANVANERLTEVVKLMNAEFVEKELASSNPHAMVYGPKGSQGANDIMIRLVDVADITSETDSEEAYKITIGSLGVVIEAASENAVMHAFRTIQALMLTNNGLVYGTIVDYPEVEERRLHVDCGRKYFSKDWFIRQIRELSYLKMNAIQIHFAENLGFRIECETDPAIVSDEHLTKAEVREIIAEAEKYGIKVIPSLDTPGHVQHILKTHPEYGQIDTYGNRSTTALDITSEEAVAYIYSLYDEYMELFEGCEDFHIGSDEYMEYDRAPFTTSYKPVLDQYAVEKYGAGYTWREAMAGYTNDLAAHVYSKGFKPRIYNDGVYFNEGSSSQQKFPMHDYIGVDYWSRTSWIGGSPSLETFINRGHDVIYNLNSSYFYYVLRNGPQSDGRPANSFDVKEQYKNIYNNWTPGKFAGSTISDDSEVIAGASLCIWCDFPNTVTEDVVHTDIAKELRSLSAKAWNPASNTILAYDKFAAMTDVIGNVAGYEKGSELPEVGEFTELDNLGKVVIKYQDTKGNTIKADDVVYGEYDEAYSFTAPAIVKWLPVSDEAVTGTYKEADGEIIFVYDVDPNPPMSASKMKTYPSVLEYQTTGDSFRLKDDSRIVVISNEQSLQNEVLEKDMKLLSSEFTEVGLTDTSMNIVFGTDTTPKAGDIVVRLEPVSKDSNPEGYEIDVDAYAEVTSTGEAGIFYGLRTILKTMVLNNGAMDDGRIVDEPSVSVRSFHLDNARKMFTKDWILAMIKDLSYQNYNSLQFHFSENEGYRLESSTLEALDGWKYPSNGYFTKADMLEIIEECNKYHIELVPSLDSPGHMTYVLNYLPDDWDCTSIWPSDFRSAQTFNIFEKQECRDFLKELFTEYAEFFSEAGCKHFNIGGDEFLNNFGSMTNDQYISVMEYFNEISELVKSYGMTPRAWNDGLMYKGYTGYKLDPDIEICYWSGPAKCATIEDFVNNGNKVINFADVYMYFALSSWWMSNANAAGNKIFNEWHPGKLANSSVVGDQSITYPYDDFLLGSSYALWCDDPNFMSQESVTSNLFMRTRATGEKAWNPNSAYTYGNLENVCNSLGTAPGYDGEALPAPGEVLYEGEFGTLVYKYVDMDGNQIKDDKIVYGLIDEEYTVQPDDIYEYYFVSLEGDEAGVYIDGEIVVTLTYIRYVDRFDLYDAIMDEKAEEDYIPATFAEYKAALKEAKLTYNNEDAGQKEIDDALKALLAAEAKLVSLDYVQLYMEVTYPAGSAGYTTGSYSDYQAAVASGKALLNDQNITKEKADAALAAIREAKDDLVIVAGDGFITVTATDPTYFAGSYGFANMLDNNMNTFTWLSDAQQAGDELKFTFASPIKLNSFRYQAPSGAGSDIFTDAVVEVSLDGQTWTEVGTLKNETDKIITVGGEMIQYVRVRVVGEAEYWVKIAEATFDYETAEVDTAALDEAIASTEDLDQSKYTDASWALVEAAVESAEALKDKDGLTTGEIVAAVAAIEGAVEALAEPSEDEVITVEPPKTPDIVVPDPWVNPFKDVAEGKYYYEPVAWGSQNGIVNGLKADEFGPKAECTRGQIVTFIWRAMGKPAAENGENKFTDVVEGKYYYDAVIWAVEKGIVNGLTDTTFGPDETCTRAQMATFLYRHAGEPAPAAACPFPDVAAGKWYTNAATWASEQGIVTGYEDGTFGTNDKVLREQTVTMLYRYFK